MKITLDTENLQEVKIVYEFLLKILNENNVQISTVQPVEPVYIDTCGLTTMTRNALLSQGFSTIEDIVSKTEGEIKNLHGIGNRGFNEIQNLLALHKVWFKPRSKNLIE